MSDDTPRIEGTTFIYECDCGTTVDAALEELVIAAAERETVVIVCPECDSVFELSDEFAESLREIAAEAAERGQA